MNKLRKTNDNALLTLKTHVSRIRFFNAFQIRLREKRFIRKTALCNLRHVANVHDDRLYDGPNGNAIFNDPRVPSREIYYCK